MKIVERKVSIFKLKQVFFSDRPYDIDDCDVVMFSYCRNRVDVPGFHRQEAYTSVIDLTKNLDEIWKNMDKSSCRYSIRKAERDGVEIVVNKHYDDFYKIYRSFRQKKGLESGLIGLLGMGSLKLEEIKKYGLLFVAKHEDDVLGGHLYLHDDSSIIFWQAATKRLDVGKDKAKLIGNASKLIHWEAIKYAKEMGIEEFDMGGLFPEEDAKKDISKYNINFFKLSFGGKIIKVYHYKKIYSKLYKFGSNLYNIIKCLR